VYQGRDQYVSPGNHTAWGEIWQCVTLKTQCITYLSTYRQYTVCSEQLHWLFRDNASYVMGDGRCILGQCTGCSNVKRCVFRYNALRNRGWCTMYSRVMHYIRGISTVSRIGISSNKRRACICILNKTVELIILNNAVLYFGIGINIDSTCRV
jgi:hypothetical protein